MKEPARLYDTVSAHSFIGLEAQSIPYSACSFIFPGDMGTWCHMNILVVVYVLQLRLFRWVFLIVFEGNVNGLVQMLRA